MKIARVYKNEFGKYSVIVHRAYSFVDEDELFQSLKNKTIIFEYSYSARSFAFFKIIQKKPFK